MRTLPIIVTLALGLALAAPAAAGPGFSARTGSPSSSVGALRGGGAAWLDRRVKQRTGRREHRRTGRRRHNGLFLFGRHSYYDRRHREREPAPVAPPPALMPPVAVTPAEPPAPLDPRGPLRLTPARGILPAEAPYHLGEALPAGLPHVTLAWRQYALPEPPPGRLYARVGRDVLLITAAGRIVERVLPPR